MNFPDRLQASAKPRPFAIALPWWPGILMGFFVGLAALVYWPGLHGGYVFDDYPNIVDNAGVHPKEATVATLTAAALSSPSSEFKRPLASLSFAANFLVGGNDPFGMKLVNLLIHLANGLCFYFLAARIARIARLPEPLATWLAPLVAGGWLLLPINLTAVLYVVQRMESLANLFVLLGLLGYMASRDRMREGKRGMFGALTSLALGTILGLGAKETAVLLPLYAGVIEVWLYRGQTQPGRIDRRIVATFATLLGVPMVIGGLWLFPGLLRPETWANRDFGLADRLLSEARIVVDYVSWTIFPTHDLSFYHDDFVISRGLFAPWTTAACMALLVLTIAAIWFGRRRAQVATLGAALFFACHTLTATVLPLELIYEHRNYFASFGLLLALFSVLLGWMGRASTTRTSRQLGVAVIVIALGAWSIVTAGTAYAWGEPLRLARELADRGPASARAQYELGRMYVILSGYKATSPYTPLAYAPLQRSAAIPGSSILAEQALIFLNARMSAPIDPSWWDSITRKLKARVATVQDESSLDALATCQRDNRCNLPVERMVEAFMAAVSHPNPSARLLAIYGSYAWNSMDDNELARRLLAESVAKAPREPAYRSTLIRMQLDDGLVGPARENLAVLRHMDHAGELAGDIADIEKSMPKPPDAPKALESTHHDQ